MLPANARLHVRSIPGPMSKYWADNTKEGEYVTLSMALAVASAVIAELSYKQNIEWLEYWAQELVQEVHNSAYIFGQNSVRLAYD